MKNKIEEDKIEEEIGNIINCIDLKNLSNKHSHSLDVIQEKKFKYSYS